jgi:hypothetical protein
MLHVNKDSYYFFILYLNTAVVKRFHPYYFIKRYDNNTEKSEYLFSFYIIGLKFFTFTNNFLLVHEFLLSFHLP